MIRFMPDTWVDVVMRPLDMVSPEANIYVEVSAPDLRLAAALLLAVAVLVLARRHQGRRPALTLLALVLLAMVPWLATTGNGRYFTPFLLLLGPLCIGLIRLLPFSGSVKISTAVVLLALQAFLVHETSPWGAWALASWRGSPYFEISGVPQEPRSYVTLTPISYSLIAPQFPPGSRWMNLSAPVVGPREKAYSRNWLAKARSLYLVAPSLPGQMDDTAQPSAAVVKVFDQIIGDRGLSVERGARCDFLPSTGVARVSMREHVEDDPQAASRYGFWLCPLHYDAQAALQPATRTRDPAVEATFAAVEAMCPRFFPHGEAETQRLDDGSTRHYSESDTRVYVMDDGEVLYKFWRSINPVTIGRRADVLAGNVHLDCSKIRAPIWRSGGP